MGLAVGPDCMDEIGRKIFHMLSLAYLAAYHFIGYPRVLPWFLGWSACVVAIETGRFYVPSLNQGLAAFFGKMARESELNHYSGIFHTTLGVLLVILAFGDRPKLIVAPVLYLALGDAAAALIGRFFGRHKLFGGKKSLEGSLACLAVCLLVGGWLGLPWPAAFAGALSATLIELLPNNRYFNDNLWMPLGAAIALSFFAS